MSDADDTLKGDEKIVSEAKTRFRRAQDWERAARDRFLADTKFCEGDSDNNYQWEDTIRNRRMTDQRPCLTVNKTRQHCLQIVNDARQNKAQIRLIPTGDGATYESAKIFEGITRHIEYISNALEAYDSATWRQVTGGWGYWRVVTDYLDDKSFDQEIYIRRIPDPLSVYLDPDIQEFDGSDARFGFVFKDWTYDEFDAEYPDERDKSGDLPFSDDNGWLAKDHIRVAEYFRKSDKPDELLLLADNSAVPKSALAKDALPDGAKPGAVANVGGAWLPIVKTRPVTRAEIDWFKIAGDRIIERTIWPGCYIPLVRVIGEETIIEGQLDRKGHTRALKDPQRMYNYQTSAMVEAIALQSKSPYITAVESLEGLETYWENANRENRAYLPYNALTDEGAAIPPPQRQNPPSMPAAYIEAMKVAQTELMMASGQWQAQMGENENAKSGVAINARQRQGDNATYHYIDHLAQAIKFTGKILIDLIPKIYDTPRVIKIMAEDGDQSEVHIDPTASQPSQMVAPGPQGPQPITEGQAQKVQGDEDLAANIKTIFNPKVGKYDVEADVGPAYATRRQETFQALTQLMQASPDLMKVAGDLMMRAADFPMADELAERLKRMVPPQILGQGPSPDAIQIQQEAEAKMQAVQQMTTHLVQQLSEATAKLKDKDAEMKIKDYEAETRRMQVAGAIDQDAMKLVVRSELSQLLGIPVVPAMAAHAEAEQAMQPQPEPEMQAEAAE
jgi:hypothetical protein